MKKDLEDRLSTFWNIISGGVAPEDYIAAAVLINEVRMQMQDKKGDETPDQVYACLLAAADGVGIKNPFRDKANFFLIYKESKTLKRLDWENVIAQVAVESKLLVLPAALIKIYENRFSIEPDTVLIAEAEKFIPNLQQIVDRNINSHFILSTQNNVYAKVLEYVFEGYENVEIIITDIYCYEFVNRRFDLILSCPNFGGRMLVEAQNFICREFDMVALENLSLHLNSGGRLVITLPGRITFASGKVRDLRQFIQMTYIIKEIGELPEGTIEYSGIRLYLLDIENNRPEDEDIIVRRYTSGEKKIKRAAVTSLDVADDTFVMLSELEEQGDWIISRIFAQQDEDYLSFQNSRVRKTMLGTVAEVFRGKSITRKDLAGNIGVINISNIGEYEIDYAGLEHLQEEERKVSNYLLREGDVLLPARGTAFRTAVFHEQKYPCIASSNLIVIRPDIKMLNSIYLKIFLDSPIGNKTVSSAQQGTTVMNISYKDLKNLEVPLPSIDNQHNIVQEYLTELTKYQETLNAAKMRWAEVLDRLYKF